MSATVDCNAATRDSSSLFASSIRATSAFNAPARSTSVAYDAFASAARRASTCSASRASPRRCCACDSFSSAARCSWSSRAIDSRASRCRASRPCRCSSAPRRSISSSSNFFCTFCRSSAERCSCISRPRIAFSSRCRSAFTAATAFDTWAMRVSSAATSDTD